MSLNIPLAVRALRLANFPLPLANVKMLIEYAYLVCKINISGGPARISTDPDFETTDPYYLGPPPTTSRWSLGDERYDNDAQTDSKATIN
jgi:hypothetical protein